MPLNASANCNANSANAMRSHDSAQLCCREFSQTVSKGIIITQGVQRVEILGDHGRPPQFFTVSFAEAEFENQRPKSTFRFSFSDGGQHFLPCENVSRVGADSAGRGVRHPPERARDRPQGRFPRDQMLREQGRWPCESALTHCHTKRLLVGLNKLPGRPRRWIINPCDP